MAAEELLTQSRPANSVHNQQRGGEETLLVCRD